MKPTTGKLAIAALILALSSIAVSCAPRIFYSTGLEIDRNLHLIPTPVSTSNEPSTGGYYFFSHSASGMISVDHFYRKTEAAKRERLLYLETDHNRVLERTVKSDEILKGQFGTVYAEKTCFFARPITNYYNYISVQAYSNQLDHEVPSELSRPPESLPPLTSVSLVRVFHAAPQYLIVSANYEADGELDSLHIDGGKDGDWVHSNFVPAAVDSFVQRIPKDRGSGALKKYGIPARIDIREYLSAHRLPLPPSALAEQMSVMNLLYGYDKLIRQDELKDGAIISTRFLQPSVTDEEITLGPECESRFGQQRAMGLPTVE